MQGIINHTHINFLHLMIIDMKKIQVMMRNEVAERMFLLVVN